MNTKKLTNAQARFLGKVAQLLAGNRRAQFKALPGGIAINVGDERGWLVWMTFGRGERVALDGICLSGHVRNVGETATDARWELTAPIAEVALVDFFCGLVARALYLAEYGS